MLLDLRLLLEAAATSSSTGSTGAPAVTGRGPHDEIYANYMRRVRASMLDEEAALALYVADEIDFDTLLRVVERVG